MGFGYKRKFISVHKHSHAVFTATQNDLPHSFLPPTSTGSSAPSLNPVAVVTLLLYTMAGWLHNVFLLVQFVAHTTAEWAWSTPNHPPTLRSMLMKSLPSPGSFHTKSYRTAESFGACGVCPAAKATSFWMFCHWQNPTGLAVSFISSSALIVSQNLSAMSQTNEKLTLRISDNDIHI